MTAPTGFGVNDVIQKQPVEDYLVATLPERNAFLLSGAATNYPDSAAKFGGTSIVSPNWVPDDSDDEVNDGTPSTPGTIASRSDIAPILKRKRVWGAQGNLKAALGLQDANAATNIVKSQFGFYIPRRIDKTIVRMLTGMLDPTSGALRSSHVNDISKTSSAKGVANFGSVVDTMLKQGDTMGEIAVFVGHSFVWADLSKEAHARETQELQNVVDPETGAVSQQMVTVMRYAGRPFILADVLPVGGSGAYRNYLLLGLKRGALAINWQEQIDLTQAWDATIPQLNLCIEYAYGPILRGMAYQGTVPAVGPSDANLIDPSKWAKATNVLDKQIGLVALRCNASAAS